jgi:hypothetical protein
VPPAAEARSLAPVKPIEPRRASQPELAAPDAPTASVDATTQAQTVSRAAPGSALLQPLTSAAAPRPEPAVAPCEAAAHEPEPSATEAAPDLEKITEEYVPLRAQLARPAASDETPPVPGPETLQAELLDRALDSAPQDMPPIPPDADEPTAEEAELLLADHELILDALPPQPGAVAAAADWLTAAPESEALNPLSGREMSRVVSGEITINSGPRTATPAAPEVSAPESTALPLTEATAAMHRAEDRDSLLSALARGAHSLLECVQIYVPRQGVLVGHFEIASGNINRQDVRRRRLATNVPSVVSRAMNEGSLYLGPIPDTDASATVMLSAGILSGEGIALIPVQIKGRSVCLLVGHDYDRPISARVRAPLARLADEAAHALARLIVQLKQHPAKKPVAPVAKVEVSWEALPREPPPGGRTFPARPELPPVSGTPAPPVSTPAPHDADTDRIPTVPGPSTTGRVAPGEPLGRIPTGPLQPALHRVPTGPIPDSPRPPMGPGEPVSQHAKGVPAGRRPVPPTGFQFDTVQPVAHIPALETRPEPSSATLPELIDELEAGGGSAEWAEGRLRSFGASAIAALMARFPGRLRVDRFAVHGTLPPISQCSAVLKALASFGRPVILALAPLFHSRDAEARFYVTYLLSELVYPEAVALLATRLQDKDPDVRRIAALTLGKFREMEQFPGVLLDLRADLHNPDPRPRRAAAEALAALGDGDSVPALVDMLADADQTVVEATVSSLVTLTKQDYARNEKKWRAWWERNNHRHRMEWLIDGLVHKAPDIRAAAITELDQLTGLSFDYSFDMPRREREAIRRRFVDWWAEIGIEMFR